MKEVYITNVAKFLPNKAIGNDEMEDYLGLINGNLSKSRHLILRNNKITQRYYALDKNGCSTHTNAEMAAEAIRNLFTSATQLEEVDLLTAGTSSPDMIQPAHASMVHGELGGQPIEVMSAEGTCNSAMVALKYAIMAIQTGDKKKAVCSGSEKFSMWMHAKNFTGEVDKRKEIEENPYIAFEKDFLRWMLSDGAAATLLQDQPNKEGISLKVEWIDIRSFANELEPCMYAGCHKDENGKLVGWHEFSTQEVLQNSSLSLRQEPKLLQKHIITSGARHLEAIKKARNFDEGSIDYFLPHLSSMFFKQQIFDIFARENLFIPEEKWFVNLTKVGNVGSASGFLMLEELFHSGRLKKGQRILMMIPESARFSYTFLLLEVV